MSAHVYASPNGVLEACGHQPNCGSDILEEDWLILSKVEQGILVLPSAPNAHLLWLVKYSYAVWTVSVRGPKLNSFNVYAVVWLYTQFKFLRYSPVYLTLRPKKPWRRKCFWSNYDWVLSLCSSHIVFVWNVVYQERTCMTDNILLYSKIATTLVGKMESGGYRCCNHIHPKEYTYRNS